VKLDYNNIKTLKYKYKFYKRVLLF